MTHSLLLNATSSESWKTNKKTTEGNMAGERRRNLSAELMLMGNKGNEVLEEAFQLIDANQHEEAIATLSEYIDEATAFVTEAAPVFDSNQADPRLLDSLQDSIASHFVMRAATAVELVKHGHPQSPLLRQLARQDTEIMGQFPVRWFSDGERKIILQLRQFLKI